jgi:hypothetical protein
MKRKSSKTSKYVLLDKPFSSCCGHTEFFKKYLSDILLHIDIRCHTSFISLTKCISLLFIDKGKKTTINRNELQLFMTLRS